MKTITGIWQDARGNFAAWGRLHLKLNQDAVVKSTNQVAPREVAFPLTQNGALMFDARVWANDELSPDGTYYTATVTAFGGGLIWGPQWIVISGPDPVNLNAILPVLTIPPTDQAASMSIVTSPTLVAGVMDASITGPNGVSTNLVTVSDQLVLCGGSNVSLRGSFNQQSLTLSVDAPTPPVLGLADVTANGLMFYAGSNITLASSIDVSCLSITVHGGAGGGGGGGGFTAGAEGATNADRLYLYAGSNMTLATATDFSGLSVQLNGPFTSQLTSLTTGITTLTTHLTSLTTDVTSLTTGLTSLTTEFTSISAGGFTLGAGPPFGGVNMGFSGPWYSSVALRAGNNITFNGQLGNNQASGNLIIYGNRYDFYEGDNITLSSDSAGSGNHSLTINGAPPGMSQVVFYNSTQGGLWLGANSIAYLYAGSNVSFAYNPPTGGFNNTASVTINAGGGGGGLNVGVNYLTDVGSADFLSGMAVSTLAFFAGSNVSLRTSTLTPGVLSLYINVPNAGGGGGTAPIFSVAAGSNVTMATQTGVSGTTGTINGNPSLAFWGNSNTTGGSWSGLTSIASNVRTLGIFAGENVFISRMTLASREDLRFNVPGSGFTSLTSQFTSLTNVTTMTASLTTLSSISNATQVYLQGGLGVSLGSQLSSNSQTIIINATGGGGGGGGSFMAGALGQLVTNQLMLTSGANLSLQTTTGASGMTVGFSAIPQGSLTTALTSYNNWTASSSNWNSAGNWSASSSAWNAATGATVNRSVSLVSSVAAGVTQVTSTNGTTFTISAPHTSQLTSYNLWTASSANWNAATGGGPITVPSFSGGANGQFVTNQFMLTQGANMSLSTTTNANGMTVTISALAQGSLTTHLTSLTSQFTSITNATALNSVGGRVSLVQSVAAGVTSVSNTTGSVFTISAPHTTQLTSYNNWTNSSGNWNTAGNWTASSAAWNAAAGGTFPVFTAQANAQTNSVALRLTQGANMSLQTATNASGMIVTLSAVAQGSLTTALTSYNNWTNSSSAWNTAGNWSASSSNWDNATTGGGGAGGDSRYFAAIKPIIPTYTTWSGFGQWGYSCSLWPLDRPAPGNYSSVYQLWNFSWPAGLSGAATAGGGITMSVGFYTRTGSTLSRVSSGSSGYPISITAQSNLTNFNQLKLLKIPVTGGINFDDNRDYWAAFCMSSATAGFAYSHSGVAYEYGMSGNAAGEFGQATNSTWQRVPFWGVFTGANSLPVSVALNQIRGTSATMGRVPMMWLGGWTG